MAIIQKQSMSAQVIDHILGQIESGELKPGDKLLNERDFAEQLGISRVPLREAMCALTALGILTTRQGDGTFVNHFNEGMLGRILYIYTILDEISSGDLMELRVALEAGTAAAAAERRTDEDLAAIQKEKNRFIEKYEEIKAGGNDFKGLLEADHSFHNTIGVAAKNKLYREFLDAVRIPFSRIELSEDRETTLKNFGRSLENHNRIVDAIEKQEKMKAYQAMEEHIKEVSIQAAKE